MARAKKDNGKKHRMIRYVAVCGLWALLLFMLLACVTFRVNQRMMIADPNFHGLQDGLVTNHLVGPLGTTLAFLVLENIGPGVFVGLVLLAALLVVWTRGEALRDGGLRIAGSVLLVVVVSATFHLIRGGAGGHELPVQTGGYLGTAVGEFLRERFGVAGTVLILLVTVIVGMLLVADELMLGLPAKLLYTWQRVPKRQLAGGAATVVGGFWGHVRDFVDALGSRGYMGRRGTVRAGGAGRVSEGGGRVTESSREVDGGGVENPKEAAESKAAAEGARVPGEDEDDDASPVPPLAPPGDVGGRPIVRKPNAAAKGPMLPFKPTMPTPAPKAQDLGNYKIPGLDLLDEAEPLNMVGQEQRVREKARVLEQSLESFGIDAKVDAIETGPVVTMYELTLGTGIKSSQVGALSKDVARALKSPPVRIIDNIPGKSTMGIEVPNMDRERVRLKELMVLGHDKIEGMALPMCLGKDAAGNPLIEDLTTMPHMLIAGTTGSGKSVCINSIIMTLLLTQRPDHVKMIMVDPKMVEMQDYKSIPHLMAPIIDDMAKAESILEWATQKMDERYEILSEAGVRHIKAFNKLTKDQICERFEARTEEDKARLVFHLPYIVIIIDELADLMMTSKDVEGHIVRIAQKARAVGIHLILATQRPEAQVVTGLIKSNMPGRICFQVRSRLDSRIMLDQSGGELLLGQGDLLMLKPTGGGLVRGQGAFVDDKEMRNVCGFLKEVAEPEFHPELLQLGAASGLGEGEEKDELFNQAVDVMIESGRGSVSLIQRRLNIGYSRASRIIDQMRRTGIVGAYKGSVASEVTLTKEQWEEMKAQMAGGGGGPAVPRGGGGTAGSTGGEIGSGSSAGFAQQVSSAFDPDGPAAHEEADGGVPDEMPGEHRQ